MKKEKKKSDGVLVSIDPRYEWSITFGSHISNFAKPAFDWSKRFAKRALIGLKKKVARGIYLQNTCDVH